MTNAGPYPSSRKATPIWTRNFLCAVIINFSVATVFYMFSTMMALYAIEQFSVSEIGGGAAAGTFVLGGVAIRLFGGKYLDLFGRGRVLRVSLVACAAISLVHLCAPNFTMLIILRVIHGLAFGAASTAVGTIGIAMIPSARKAEGTGYFSMSATVGSAIGPWLAALTMGRLGPDSIFWLGMIIPLVSLLVCIFMQISERNAHEIDRAQLRSVNPSSFVDYRAARISSLMFVVAIAFAAVLAFVDAYGLSQGATGQGGKFFIAYAAAVLTGRFFVGRIQDSFGDNIVIYTLIMLLAIGLVVLSLDVRGWTLYAAAILMGFGFGSLLPAILTISVKNAAESRVALIISTFYVFADTGIGAGPIIAGLLIPWIGYRALFLVLAALVAASTLQYRVIQASATASPGSCSKP